MIDAPGPSQTSSGRDVPGTVRKATASRFHPLMAAIASVRSANSFSVHFWRASSCTSSGTRLPATRLAASVQANAARSRLVKNGVSFQALSAWNRCSLSPWVRASLGRLSRQ